MKLLLLLAALTTLRIASIAQGCSTNYVDPSFELQKTDPACNPNGGSIQAVNISGGVAPYTFKLVETGAVNNTGLFTNLPVGLYTVEMRDACGTVRARQVTLVPFSFSFTYTVTKTDSCSNGQVVITPSPASATYTYGVVRNGDTTWSSSPTINIKLYKRLIILVKDQCGNVQFQQWDAPPQFLPYIAELQHRLQCDKWDLFPVYYGFNNPTVCVYKYPSNQLVACKSAPGNYTTGPLTNFYDLPWGDYYVIVSDNCYRDSAFHPDQRSAGGSELNPYNWDCTTFTMHVDGLADTVCLYNAKTNQLISCKGQDTVSINPRTGVPWPSGAVWENLPYGCYYAWIYDPCMDSTFKIDSCVRYPFNMQTIAGANCNFDQAAIGVTFDPGSKGPYTSTVFYPDGTIAATKTSAQNFNYLTFNVYTGPGGDTLKVINEDACGNKDSSFVKQERAIVDKSFSVMQKCPGVSGNSGSGDITIQTRVNISYVQTIPTIIKKNGNDTTVNYSYSSASNGTQTFTFANLLTGVYIVKYAFTPCGGNTYYDTVEIKDYEYPSQRPDTAIQCGGNQFTFTFPVLGGLAPYTFQVIESTPTQPSLITPVQSSPTFTFANGHHYTSVKVRAIDRCGNSTIGDVAIQPINGCSILLVDTTQNNPALQSSLAKVYPNPSQGSFVIAISQKKKSDYLVEVINASGVRLFSRSLSNVDRKDVLVNEHFAPGLYIVNVTDLRTGRRSVFKEIIN